MALKSIWLGDPINPAVDLKALAAIGADVVPAGKPGYYHIVFPENWRIEHPLISYHHLVKHMPSGIIQPYFSIDPGWRARDLEPTLRISDELAKHGWHYHSAIRWAPPTVVEYDTCGRRRRSFSYHALFFGCKWWDPWRYPREAYTPEWLRTKFLGMEIDRPQVELKLRPAGSFFDIEVDLDPTSQCTGVWITKRVCGWCESNVLQFWPKTSIANTEARRKTSADRHREAQDWLDEMYPNWRDSTAYWDDPELNALDPFVKQFHRHVA